MNMKTNTIQAGKWDFYLADVKKHLYMHCMLKSYHLEKDGIENDLGYTGPCVRFLYEMNPNIIRRKPNGLLLTIGQAIDFLFTAENPFFYKKCIHDMSIKCKGIGKTLNVDSSFTMEDLISALGTETGELELIYYSIMSTSNPMASLIYLLQLKKAKVESIFLEYDPVYLLIQMEYQSRKKQLRFYIDEDYNCVVPGTPGDVGSIAEDQYLDGWYQFECFDFVRSVSRCVSCEQLLNEIGSIKVTVEYLSDEIKTYEINDKDSYFNLMATLCDEKGEIKQAYIDGIERKYLNEFIIKNYAWSDKRKVPEEQVCVGGILKKGISEYIRGELENTPHALELEIPEEAFLEEYEQIPAIADNDSIIEV